jgi:hypothetical protein
MTGQVERSSEIGRDTQHTGVVLAWTYRGERKDVLLRLTSYGLTLDTKLIRSILKRCATFSGVGCER